MEIHQKFDHIEGTFDMSTGELICVGNPKYSRVDLCFKGSMHIAFAQIKLHSKDRAVDAAAVYDDALILGAEIAQRWNAFAVIHDGQIDEAIEGLK